jgi:DnaJ homolog subfamily B member 11
MPNYENNNLQGTLYITFDVDFPTKRDFTAEEKEEIRKLLAQPANNRIYNGLRGS